MKFVHKRCGQTPAVILHQEVEVPDRWKLGRDSKYRLHTAEGEPEDLMTCGSCGGLIQGRERQQLQKHLHAE